MTTASVSSAPGSSSSPGARDVPGSRPDALARLRLVLDRRLPGRVPEAVRPHVDVSAGMLEFLVDDGSGDAVVLAIAPGARGDTVVPLLPAPPVDDPEGEDVSFDAPFDELIGEAVEDVSRVITHLEHPDEMRGLVLHLGGRMLMVYADLWELRVSLLP